MKPAALISRHRRKFIFLGVVAILLLTAQIHGCFRSAPPGYNMGVLGDLLEHYVYPHGMPKDPGNVKQDALLETLWPEMGPRTFGNRKTFEVRGGGRTLIIYFGSGAVDPKIHAKDQLHVILDNAISSLKRVCIVKPKLPKGFICHHLKHLARKPDKFGLKHIGVDFSQFPDLPREDYRSYDDIYYTPQLGAALTTFVQCTANEMGPTVSGSEYFPQCDQYFIFKPLNACVNVSYRRVYLKDWRGIQAAVKKLLQSFIVQRQHRSTTKSEERRPI
ncbi:MAG TPA: hypothetical protein DEP05_05880 [Betaproteobacteria bacterium]|nr:hypothetical protein [Betaproteobacteria bacterium]